MKKYFNNVELNKIIFLEINYKTLPSIKNLHLSITRSLSLLKINNKILLKYAKALLLKE